MQLPGLPKTKARIIDRAANEGWSFEEIKGVGGTRKVYDVPKKYLASSVVSGEMPIDNPNTGRVIGTIAGGKVDPKLLETVIRVMDEWAIEQDISWVPERKASIAVLLYDYIDKGASDEDVTRLLQAVK
jgi:hypothetical protein